jgi:flagellar basal-body rod protein FlgB
MQLTSATSEALGKYLDLSSAQMRLTATNMANVDTPGYKTQGFDFGTEFSRALSGAAGAQSGPNVEETDGLVARPDGNNVSMDREGVNLAKAQLQFKMGVSLLRSEYSRTMSAIHGDGK